MQKRKAQRRLRQFYFVARAHRFDAQSRQRLRQLGEVINYNAYGDVVTDLHIAPDELANRIAPYTSPFEFIASDDALERLVNGCESDMAKARACRPVEADSVLAAFVLPDAAWARRVSGVFSNQCVESFPDRAHIVATIDPQGRYTISLRAPRSNAQCADDVAVMFGGGGRHAAAGINRFDPARLSELLAAMRRVYGKS